MIRLFFILTSVLFCAYFSRATQAADAANLNVIGFSADTRYFAFEQYGIEDGSGFPYSEIFVVDLENNAWIQGTPFRARSEKDGERLSVVRKEVNSKASSLLESLAIEEPPDILASNQATEVLSDRNHVQFDRWFMSSTQGSQPEPNGSADETRYELSIESVPATQPSNCSPEDGATVGFSLSLREFKTGSTHVLHLDKAIPSSRNCPSGYDIQAVISSTGYPTIDRLVAIVGVYSRGFEGSNRRFLAVPFLLK